MNGCGENFLTPAPGAGQASPRTLPNGDFGPAREGPQKGPEMEQKRSPKWVQNRAFFGGRKAAKPFVSLVFPLKMGPRRGPKNEPEMVPKLGQMGRFGVKLRSKSG